MKTAIIIISDPKGGEESLARLFNALTLAQESKNAGDQLEVSFTGTGTRWPEELVKVSHPANDLYNEIQECIVGASHGCAQVFGATCGLESTGTALLTDHTVSETTKVLSIHRYLKEDWKTVLF